MSNRAINVFLGRFRRWAASQIDIHAVALVGSYARNAATETSDVDLIILTEQPDSYLNDRAWVRLVGDVESEQIEDYVKLTALRVRDDSGLSAGGPRG